MASQHLMVHRDKAHPRCSIFRSLSNLSCLLLQPGRNVSDRLLIEDNIYSSQKRQKNNLLLSSVLYLHAYFSHHQRYKESISKSTRGLKEKLVARNNSVKELSKGVQREMSAGIAGVARMFERLDLASKKPGAPTPVPVRSGGTSNFSVKGKGVLENVIVHSCNKSSGRIADESSEAPCHIIRPT